MGVQPASLQAGLTPASQSRDVTAPTSTIQSPHAGATVQTGSEVTISGTASRLGRGRFGALKCQLMAELPGGPRLVREAGLCVDSSSTGSVTIKSRAVDDSGNLENPPAGVTVTVAGSQTTIWSNTAAPGTLRIQDRTTPVELGVKFYSEVGGTSQGNPFLQVASQHRNARWQSLVEYRDFVGIGAIFRMKRHQAGNKQTSRRQCR